MNNLRRVVKENPGHYSLPPGEEKPSQLVDHICGKRLLLYTNAMARIKDHSQSGPHTNALKRVNDTRITMRQPAIQPFSMPALEQKTQGMKERNQR